MKSKKETSETLKLHQNAQFKGYRIPDVFAPTGHRTTKILEPVGHLKNFWDTGHQTLDT